MTDTCGCCAGIEQITPITIINRPGLSALLYRIGTHATFLETMLARLSSLSVPLGELGPLLSPGQDPTALVYPLQSLTTRSTGDPAIALLDAWAIVGDVFTFYQERIANEGYLRTATLRRSILELARLVGYKLAPGVASSTYLAYTLQAGYDTLIPAGSRAQNIPAAGQLPQSFETSQDLQTRAAWSNLQPRMSIPEYIIQQDTSTIDINTPDGSLYLAGTSTNLKPHDPVLFVFGDGDSQQVFAHTQSVVPNAAEKYTNVTFPVTFAPDAFNRNFANMINRYINVEAFGLSPSNAAVQEVVAGLKHIKNELPSAPLLGSEGGGVTLYIIETNVGEWQVLYEEIVGIGKVEGDVTVKPQVQSSTADTLQIANWLGSLVNDVTTSLNEVRDFVGGSRKTAEALLPEAASSVGHEHPHPPVVITGLGTLISPLIQQPASSAPLTRDIKDAFARTGDIAPQLLTAFYPQIKSTLYTAYSKAQVSPPPPLQEFDALRVKAAPFGSSAPKQAATTQSKPTSGKTKFTTTYTEWPIAEEPFVDSTFIVIQLAPYASTDTMVTLNFSFRQGTIMASSTQQITIPTSSVSIPLPSNNPAIIFTVTVAGTGSPSKLTSIKIASNNTPTITLKPDNNVWDTEVDKSDNFGITMNYDDQGNFNISLAAFNPLIVLDLDARYDHIVPGSWIVIEATSALQSPFPTKALQVQIVETIARADYGMSAKVTRLTFSQPWFTSKDLGSNTFDLSLYRGINVYAQSEMLPLAGVPLTDDIAGKDIELNDLYDGLQSGRYVVVSGEQTDIPHTSGVMTSELMLLASVTQAVRTADIGPAPNIPLPNDTIHTTLHFAQSLQHTYKRSSVTVNGNVVAATQGETQNQVLGSGSGGTSMQQFSLAKAPLTYVPAVTPTGIESTLQVFANNVLWHETDTLDAAQVTDRVYITQTDDQDKVTITFGNGVHGARLPTGNENVKALYRTGIGTSGNVDIGKISQLVSRPLGVKAVNNPIAATGGADRESRDQARANVPLAATSLGRIVSVQDYADFARRFAGIGKASSAYLSDSHQQVVHLTIAGQDNIPIDPTSNLYLDLLQSLHTYGDPGEPLLLALADVKLLVISARVSIHADYLFDDVAAALRSALLDAFSFARRNLGQPVFESEVFSVMQQVAGVAYVDIDILDAIEQQQLTNALQLIQADSLLTANTGQPAPEHSDLVQLLHLTERRVVPSALARPDKQHPGQILPAQLVFLSPDVQDTLILNELTALTFKTPSPEHHLAHSHRRR